MEPSPERVRKTTWREFLAAHWDMIAAADFFAVEVWTVLRLVRFLVFFVIELTTRRVTTPACTGTRMADGWIRSAGI
jgi:hypothetical protein